MKNIGLNYLLVLFLLVAPTLSNAQQNNEYSILLKPDRVFDGYQMNENWIVIVKGNTITYAGPDKKLSGNYKIIKLPNTTLLPGMIEGHSHVLLHPYNETEWNDQVLKESRTERVTRGVNHLKANLMAGFTTLRDLGSEGAGYADVGLRTSIEKGIIPGPRLLVAGPAIVATGSYGPKGFHSDIIIPLGAEAADGIDDLTKTVRRQIGNGADFIKVYADYRWGPDKTAQPTFSIEELKLIVQIAESSGRKVVAHAATAEGMRRATLAGVSTIEHGDGGTAEVFNLMKTNGIALCPTIAAGEAISQYQGWKKGSGSAPERIIKKRESVRLAIASGIEIIAGGDVGVFSHGSNVIELELMVEYGFSTDQVLKIVTSGNAEILGFKNLGIIKKGAMADIIAVEGNPAKKISTLRNTVFVMKDGEIYKEPEI